MKPHHEIHSPLTKKWLFRTIAFSIALLGFFFLYQGCFPGLLSPDSFRQYEQALTHHYTDWHPPIMAWVWSLLNHFSKGPQNLLVLHLFLLFGGLFVFYLTYEKPHPLLSLIFFAIPFIPSIFIFTCLLWKDVGMAFSWLCAIAIFNYLHTKNLLNLKTILIPLIFFLYGFLVRGNAVIGAIVLVFYALSILRPQIKITGNIFYTVLVLVVMILISYAINYQVIKAKHTHPEIYMMMDDIQHISSKTNKNYFQKDAQVSDDMIKKCQFLVGAVYCYSVTRPNLWRELIMGTKDYYPSIKTSWEHAVGENLGLYIKYRLQAFFFLLEVSPAIRIRQFDLIPFGLQPNHNQFANYIEKINVFSTHYLQFFFTPLFWFLYSILLLALTLTMRQTPTLILSRYLLLSGICYILGYIPITPLNNFRYIYWSVIAAAISSCLIWIDCINSKDQPTTSGIRHHEL